MPKNHNDDSFVHPSSQCIYAIHYLFIAERANLLYERLMQRAAQFGCCHRCRCQSSLRAANWRCRRLNTALFIQQCTQILCNMTPKLRAGDGFRNRWRRFAQHFWFAGAYVWPWQIRWESRRWPHTMSQNHFRCNAHWTAIQRWIIPVNWICLYLQNIIWLQNTTKHCHLLCQLVFLPTKNHRGNYYSHFHPWDIRTTTARFSIGAQRNIYDRNFNIGLFEKQHKNNKNLWGCGVFFYVNINRCCPI